LFVFDVAKLRTFFDMTKFFWTFFLFVCGMFPLRSATAVSIVDSMGECDIGDLADGCVWI